MPPPNSSAASASCFALLDDCDASTADPRSHLYTGHVRTLYCRQVEQFAPMLKALQCALQDGLHAVGLFSYELGKATQAVASADQDAAPLAQILLFEDCEYMAASQVDAWLDSQANALQKIGKDIPAGIAALHSSVAADEFEAALARIRAYLESGDSYQVNYTYRLYFDAYGSLPGLYARLRRRQPVPYGALISLPDGGAVLSLSPELFLRNQAGTLTTRPMKGTAKAGADAATDARNANALAADAKGRAENLMIVDLLRNDLGRIAKTGEVRVPALFQVERHGDVLQMTSTVTAQLREQSTLHDIFDALYPCGSITGAPKRRTMQIIDELENTPRGLYTGALGWFEPIREARALGDFCLAVPIRTLLLQPENQGVRKGEMGVGAGIVYDSDTRAEYAECQLKAQFLTGLESEFELFETMHATRTGCRHVERHIQRLVTSAAYFGFKHSRQEIRDAIDAACSAMTAGEYRLRLTLRPDGHISTQSAPLVPLASPVRLLLAADPVFSDDLFLRHKTSVRHRYDAAWRQAEQHGAFDAVFFNQRGEVSEGARSSLFVQLDGNWYTPPLAAGLLPGIMRAVLLADPEWKASERSLTLDDLRRAEQIRACNALRGPLPATIDWDAPPV
jgi:para-aminobenzoate synthetase / 4-amino-4-deoxychorismate lyase